MSTEKHDQMPAATEGCAAAAGYAGDPPIPATVGHKLAMMGLQSPRYTKDAEYRDAVDAVLAWVKAARRHPVVRRGWRHFHCSECEHRWKWPSRDALSPSGENCPRCDEWCHPYHGEIDAKIPCDDMGNLTVLWNWPGEAPNDKVSDGSGH